MMATTSKLKLTYEDLADKADRNERLKYDPGVFGDDLWLEKIIDYCMDNRLMIPPGLDNADILQQAIENGFPGGNHLVITTDMVDKRRTLYKCILKVGTVVNCFVPKGERRADKTAQKEVLNDQLRTFLARVGKTIKKEASGCLVEMTGFDLRTFTSNLEKLVSYVGDRTEINVDDVEKVLERTKKDPLYELTNSVAERDIPRAIFFLDSLLSDNFHPLQMLAAITNQVRKLLIIRDFMKSPHGGSWQGPQTSYQRFRDAVMPDMQAYDRDILNRLSDWEKMTVAAESNETGKPSKRKDKTQSDLGIVKNPQNPYPVFQLAQNAQGFSLSELQAAMETLCDADLQMKSTPKNPRLILEKVIFTICRGTQK
jgi:DNA polymerase-3 subunit delta